MKPFKLATLAFVFIIASCQKDDSKGGVDIPVPGENFNFYKSAQASRSEEFSDEFEITDVDLTDNILNVAVSYNGSCESNKFDVIWNGYVMETFPQRINLIIKRTANNCDPNGELKDEILAIDLLKFMGLSSMPENTVFTVANASKIPEEDNADTTVTVTNN
jgi:hypothetical protein